MSLVGGSPPRGTAKWLYLPNKQTCFKMDCLLGELYDNDGCASCLSYEEEDIDGMSTSFGVDDYAGEDGKGGRGYRRRKLKIEPSWNDLLNKMEPVRRNESGNSNGERNTDVEPRVKKITKKRKIERHGKDGAILLSGPSNCGKTNLVVNFLYSKCCSRTKSRAILVCFQEHPVHFGRLVRLAGKEGWDTSVLERIIIKTVANVSELSEYLSNLHRAKTSVHTIVVDDFDHIYRAGANQVLSAKDMHARDTSRAAFCLALLGDACKSLECKFQTSIDHVVVMSQLENIEATSFQFRLWISQSVEIRKSSSKDNAIELHDLCTQDRRILEFEKLGTGTNETGAS